MITRSQFLMLTAMATLGGSFAGLLVVGMIAGDITLAIINLLLIVGVFAVTFTVSGDKPKKKARTGDIHIGGDVTEFFK